VVNGCHLRTCCMLALIAAEHARCCSTARPGACRRRRPDTASAPGPPPAHQNLAAHLGHMVVLDQRQRVAPAPPAQHPRPAAAGPPSSNRSAGSPAYSKAPASWDKSAIVSILAPAACRMSLKPLPRPGTRTTSPRTVTSQLRRVTRWPKGFEPNCRQRQDSGGASAARQ